jgi:pyruvate carboxylase
MSCCTRACWWLRADIPFLENVLRHPEFLAGNAKTSFIEKNAR